MTFIYRNRNWILGTKFIDFKNMSLLDIDIDCHDETLLRSICLSEFKRIFKIDPGYKVIYKFTGLNVEHVMKYPSQYAIGCNYNGYFTIGVFKINGCKNVYPTTIEDDADFGFMFDGRYWALHKSQLTMDKILNS